MWKRIVIGLALLAALPGNPIQPTPAEAAAATSERFEVASTDISCNGEVVTVTGDFHFVTRPVAGGFEVTINGHLSGVGPSGTKYEFGTNEKQSIQGSSIIAHAKTRLISQGASDNLFVATTFTSPPPTFTFDPVCRG
jgi:hypothetical protein